MIAVIMAGGKGTRIQSVNNKIPKPMIPIAGKPILEHQILRLQEQGICEIYLVVGYLGNQIQEYFEDGSRYKVSIQYIYEDEPLGSGGALYLLKELIKEDFFLINGDIMLDIDFSRMWNFHREQGGIATLFTHPNDHPFDSSLIVTGANHRIVQWVSKEEQNGDYQNRVNAGIHLFSPRIFSYYPVLEKKDLDRDILRSILPIEEVYAYDSPEYVKDMGTPERYEQVEKDILVGRVHSRNLMKPQKAVFLDRDGTINKYVSFLSKVEEMELVEGIGEIIKSLRNKGYLVIVVTNQPVIARGECTLEQLQEIHNRMETLLGQKGVYVDAIYFCPHHPDRGFAGERPEYKIKCNCRKPSTGMLLEASSRFNISLKDSWMIGDQQVDIQTGAAAGCKCIRIETNEIGKMDLAQINEVL